MKQQAYLVADIGGTNARFGLTDPETHHILVQETVPCEEFETVEQAALFFLKNHQTDREVTEGCFAVAGPVHGDEIAMTNHSWRFSTEAVRQSIGLHRLLVINDFKAQAFALPNLYESEKTTIISVEEDSIPQHSTLSVMGPGTGFGVAALTPVDHSWKAITAEGGHAGFAPINELEVELLKVLMKRYGFVSREHLLSGPGLINIYQGLHELEGRPCGELSSAQISHKALNDEDIMCKKTLSVFCDVLGSTAADIAVTQGAKGGVYIAGGIVPKIKDFFLQSGFKDRFLRPGGSYNFLKNTPVFLVTAPYPGLIGASTALDCPLTLQNK